MVEANQGNAFEDNNGVGKVQWWKTNPNVTSYMQCSGVINGFVNIGTYAVPTASMCQEACTQNPDCVFYAVENSIPGKTAQDIPANCWLSTSPPPAPNTTGSVLFLLPSSAQQTEK